MNFTKYREPTQRKSSDRGSDYVDIPRRELIQKREWEDLELSAEQLLIGSELQLYPEIQGSKYLSVHFKGSKVIFTSTHYVGHIPLNDRLALTVIPRFHVSNLTRLLRIAKASPIPLERFVRRYSASSEPLPSIFDELTGAFLRALEDVIRQGLLAQYDSLIESSTSPRGRVLISDTVLRHHVRGERFKARSSYIVPSHDNSSNRLLKYAVWLLEQRLSASTQRKGVAQTRTLLNRYFRAFHNVALDHSQRFLLAREVQNPSLLPSSRTYYAQALELALLILGDQSLDLGKHTGSISAPSMLVNLQDAFEAYIRNVLIDQFRHMAPTIEVVDGNLAVPIGGKKSLFSDAALPDCTPDVLLRQVPTSSAIPKPPIVIEVKYKTSTDRDDLNQAITYGTSYGCSCVLLAHVRKSRDQPQLYRMGEIGGLVVYRYAFDLSGHLEQEEATFADQILGLTHNYAGTSS